MDFAIVWWLLALLLVLGGLAGTLLPVLPSTPMIFAGMLLAGGLDDFQRVGWPTFAVLAVLVVFSQIMDFVAGLLGAKRAGASRLAMLGALAGSVLGLFAGIAGLLFGPLLGAAVGEYFARQDLAQAGKVGMATLLGFMLGAVAKVAVALAMLGIFAFAWFL